MSGPRWILGVDVGGTFTDVMLVDGSSGRTFRHKTASTPEAPARAVSTGVQAVLAEGQIRAADVSSFAHGTTVATNALVQGKLAKTGLITTAGFRDVLEIRRQRQPHMYDAKVQKPVPIVARHLRREAAERTYLFGLPSVPPSFDDVRQLARDLVAEGVESIAVCFLHSYHDPEHELRVAAWLRDLFPDVFVSASHDVVAEFREYERMSTTCINAALAPVLGKYLEELEDEATTTGIPVPRILLSSGGVTTPSEARRLPVPAPSTRAPRQV